MSISSVAELVRAVRMGAVRDLTVAPTLPPWTAAVVQAAAHRSGVDTRDVVLRVGRHGIRRAYFTACADEGCPLVATDPDHREGPAVGRGHLYARRRDLAACRTHGTVVAVDRTGHWVTGRAYDGVPSPRAVPRGTRYVVTLKVPQVRPDGQLPADRTYHRAKTAGATRIEVPADDLVHVMAHELHHIHQFRHGLPRSEVEAERAGREVLHRWVRDGRPGC